MPESTFTSALTLCCTQCREAIASPEEGLYAILAPASPSAGYRELHALHRACAADYEAAHGLAIPWLPLERLWPLENNDAASSSARVVAPSTGSPPRQRIL